MGKPGNTGIRRIVRATRFSAQGLAHAWQHEAAFRQEVTVAVILIPVALWLGQSVMDRLMLILSLFLVLIVELLNSAVEASVDRIGNDYHELAGRAKDMGSAAVFLSLVVVVAVWAAVACQRFFA